MPVPNEPSSSLDDEMGIPLAATLRPYPRSAPGAFLVCDSGGGSSSSISIAVETSKRAMASTPPRSIIIGRQANTVDVRIDHGSISRRHAAVYFDGSSTEAITGSRLVLQDLGGKHGTYVNGKRVDKKGSLGLRGGDRLAFGNFRERDFVVNVTSANDENGGAADLDGESYHSAPALSVEAQPNAAEKTKMGANEVEGAKTDEFEGLTGRARREAEISAMMASLDDNPSYNKYKIAAESTDGRPFENEQQTNEETTESKPIEIRRGDKQQSSSIGKYRLPVTRTAPFASTASKIATPSDPRPGGGRAVSAISIDPAGSRFVTGCSDTNLRFYDFGGMDADQNAFREVTVEEGHPIVSHCHSNTGDRILVATTSAQPKVLDRDGKEIIQFAKGDVYVTDMSRTIGHTATVTDVAWHPLERDVVMTVSLDGSARLWNLASGKTVFDKLKCDRVYCAKNGKGKRTAVTACRFHPSGREICLGTADGSIQIWNATRVKSRPERVLFDAHGVAKPVNSVVYSTDGMKVATRSLDDLVVKVWEARRISRSSRPILVAGGLPSLYDGSDCAFAPDGSVLLAGTSVEPARRNGGQRDLERGKLKFYKVPSDALGSPGGAVQMPILELEAAAPGCSIVRVAWHPKLNQIFLGTSDGGARVFYDDTLSKRGALVSVAKGVRRKDELSLLLETRAPTGSSLLSSGQIVAPHALPMYQTDKQSVSKRKREAQKDLTMAKRPQPPEGGVKMGGQTSASVNFTQFVAKASIKNKNIAGKDPREELFRYSSGKSFSSQAYEGELVLAEKTAEEEEDEERRNSRL